MPFFEQKMPLLIDLDQGVTGTFVKFEEQTTEKGMVYPVFVPLNTFKKVRYARPVPRTSITQLYPKTLHKGTEESWIVIYRGGEESLVHIIDSKFAEKVRELEEEKQTLEIENQALKQELRDAKEGLQKEMAKIRSINKGSESGPLAGQMGDNRYRDLFEDFGNRG